jgi:hypothetical protein
VSIDIYLYVIENGTLKKSCREIEIVVFKIWKLRRESLI